MFPQIHKKDMVWINKYCIFVLLITFIMLNSFQTLQPNSVAPSLNSECDKPSGLGFNFMEQEIWKPIYGFDGLYEISSLCRVRSFIEGTNKGSRKRKEPKILNPTIGGTGYYLFHCYKDGKRKTQKLHREFAKAFIPNPLNLPLINHIDGDKLNNNKYNLEWCDTLHNVRHAFKIGLVKSSSGLNHFRSKFNKKQVLDIFNSKLGYRELGRIYNVSHNVIGSIKRKTSYTEILKDI